MYVIFFSLRIYRFTRVLLIFLRRKGFYLSYIFPRRKRETFNDDVIAIFFFPNLNVTEYIYKNPLGTDMGIII